MVRKDVRNVSTNDSQVLSGCPFCGGEANTLERPHVIDIRYSVGCNDDECRGFIGLSWLYKTEAEAIAAWNTRAERTCEMEYEDQDYIEIKVERWKCRGCGWSGFVDGFGYDAPNYCPHCGAKVTPKYSEILRSEVGE